MNEFAACENAYKNGYEEGMRNAVKRGDWISTDDDMYVCPFCGKVSEFRYRFCSSCGAELRGGKNKMKIYIAGKITGCPDYREKFSAEREKLEKAGYIVLDPSTLPEGMSPSDYIRTCFAMIAVADVVVFLDDWNDSAGARLEHEYCEYVDNLHV